MNARFLRQTFHTAVFKVVILISRLLLLYLLAQTFTPADYGAFALVTTVTTFAVFLLGLNLFCYVYRAVPGRPLEERVRVLKSTFTFEVVLATTIVTLFLLLGLMSPVLEVLKAAQYENAFAIGLVLLVGLIAAAELQHYLLAKTQIEQSNWMELVTQALWVFPLLVLWQWGWNIDVSRVLIANVVGVLLGIGYAFTRIELRVWWQTRPSWPVIRTALALSVPMIVPSLSFYVLKLSDRFILSYYHSLDAVGLYSFAYTFLNTLYAFTAMVILNTFLPYAVEANNRGERERRDLFLTYGLKSSLAAFALGAGLLLTFSHPLLQWLARPEYLASGGVMLWLAIGFVMIILGYPAHYLLMLENRTVLIMVIDLIGLGIGLAGNLLLIPHYSYYGAAVATIIGFGVVAVLKHAYSRSWNSLRAKDLFSLHTEIAMAGSYLRTAVAGMQGSVSHLSQRRAAGKSGNHNRHLRVD